MELTAEDLEDYEVTDLPPSVALCVLNAREMGDAIASRDRLSAKDVLWLELLRGAR